MNAEYVRTHTEHGVLHVLIDRAGKRNALSQAVLGEIGETFRAHAADDTLRLAVLRGAGERCFAAGGDVHEFDGLRDADDVRRMQAFSTGMLDAVRTFPVPVVAAMNGDAIGGGAELAVACDLRFFAGHARIAFVQGQMCISPAWGGGADLLQLVGHATALRLLARTDFVGAEEAERLGIAQGRAEAGEPFEEALEAFLAPMRERRPHNMRAFKTLALAARRSPKWQAVRDAEPDLLMETWLHEDHWAASDAIIARISSKAR